VAGFFCFFILGATMAGFGGKLNQFGGKASQFGGKNEILAENIRKLAERGL
jgi:hypothetical protein